MMADIPDDEKKNASEKENAAQPTAGGPGDPLGARDFYFKQRGLPDDDFLPDYARQQHREEIQSQQGAEMSPTTTRKKTVKSTKGGAKDSTKGITKTATDTITTLAGDVRAGSMGATSKAAEKYLAKVAPAVIGVGATKDVAAAAFTLSVTGVSTNSQAGAQNAFLLNTDALALVINISASPDIINAGYHFTAHFQIIEFATNNVKVDVATANSPFSWGPNFWISRGNNWGPTANDYTTPAKWGLAAGLYSFRATVEVLGIGTFAASQELPFRVR
jgi:hypothetical protein